MQQQEIDYVEVEAGVIKAFESKWNPKKDKVKTPNTFREAYNAEVQVIHKNNFRAFLK